MAKPGRTAKPAVGLFAKPPRPGEVKTRLCPPLTPAGAARLYEAFLGDLADMLDGVSAWEWLVYCPEPDVLEAMWPDGAPRPLAWRRQIESDLGHRMQAALEELLCEGRPSAILLGSDHPTVTRPMIAEALCALESAEIVLGPSFDGGLYLVGWAGLHPEIFRDVPWSTGRVLDTVVRRAHEHGVRSAVVTPWYDVDDAKDLEFLRAHLGALDLEPGTRGSCPRTRAALTTWT